MDILQKADVLITKLNALKLSFRYDPIIFAAIKLTALDRW